VIRDLRLARGWSQGRLATALCEVAQRATVSREEVSRWERGKVEPGAYWLGHLAVVLQIPQEALEAMRRRTLLTDIAATAIAPVVTADLVMHGFRSSLRGGPSVDDWAGRLDAYGRDYMILGADEIRRRLARDLVVLQQQADGFGLWSVAAKLATLYAKTFPGNDGTRAVDWYRNAIEAADRSQDIQTRVWVRGRAAIALGYEGAALPWARSIADQALALSDKPSLGRLNSIMGKAHAAAFVGDQATARQLLELGRREFDVVGSAEQGSDYAVPEWRMGVFTSLLGARLGDERLAAQARDTAVASLPPTLPRFATHLAMHQGLLLANAGDRAAGIRHARAALDQLPPAKHSLTLRLLMHEIERG
jgi:transcriptional regulator with XRE-family HTH domain